MPKNEKTILDFFKVQIPGSDLSSPDEKMVDENNRRLSTPKPKAKRQKRTLFNPKKTTFKLPKISNDQDKVLKRK